MKGSLAIVMAFLALVGCGESEADREEKAMKAASPERMLPDGAIQLSDADRKALGLEVAAVHEGDLPNAALRLGVVRAPLGQEALVVSPVAGRVPRLPRVALGAVVQAGDTLLDVVPVLSGAERVSLGIQGADLAGQIESTTRELALRTADAARARELAASNIVSRAKLQEAETAAQTAQARLDALRRSKGLQASGEVGSTSLRTPVAGTVVLLNAQVGAVVRPGDVLARVLQPGTRWVDVLVPAADVAGDVYEVAAGATWLPAKLLARGAIVEEDGARHDRIEVDGVMGASVLPGATVSVRVGQGNARGVLVPEAALVPGFGSDTVYFETRPGVFVARSVQVVARFGGQLRVSDGGLTPGDKVVTRGAMALRGESQRRELRHTE